MPGILGHADLLFLAIITRTVGVPFFGPEAGSVLPITPLSLLAQISELALVLLLVVLKRHAGARVAPTTAP